MTILGLDPRLFLTRFGLVALGGALGSAARYAVALIAAEQLSITFPWGTLIVNVLGSFLVGLLATLADEFHLIGPEVRVLVVIGVLGGFTTFSSFTLDGLRLLGAHESIPGLLYLAGSLVLSFAAAWAGIGLAQAVAAR